jgi:hypothetical protein
MCTQFLYPIHPPKPFPYYLPPFSKSYQNRNRKVFNQNRLSSITNIMVNVEIILKSRTRQWCPLHYICSVLH